MAGCLGDDLCPRGRLRIGDKRERPSHLEGSVPLNQWILPLFCVWISEVTLTRVRTFFGVSLTMLKCALHCPLEKQVVSLVWKHFPTLKLYLKVTCPVNIGSDSNAEQAAAGKICLVLSYLPECSCTKEVHMEEWKEQEGTNCGCPWAR